MRIDLSGATVPELLAALAAKCDALIVGGFIKPEHRFDPGNNSVLHFSATSGNVANLNMLATVLHQRVGRAVEAHFTHGQGGIQ